MDKLKQVKSALMTALIVMFCAQILMSILTPLIPWIIFGLVVTTVCYYVYSRSTRL